MSAPSSATVKPYDTPPTRPLSQVLPLRTPLKVMIDPTNLCNFGCKFCPTGDHALLKQIKRPKGQMGLDLFQKIINDIKGFPDRLRKIHLYKDGEPLLNRQLEQMIVIAKAAGVADSIEFTSNAALLDEVRAQGIIDAGLDAIRISVEHVHDEGYQAVTQRKVKYDEIVRNVSFLYRQKKVQSSALKIHVKIIDVGLTQAEKDRFLADFSPISDSIFINAVMGWTGELDRDWTMGVKADTSIDGYSPIVSTRQVCPDPFKDMVINFNGVVSVCCVDWTMGTAVGDVSTENLVDIWHGKRLREFRLTHLRGDRHMLATCRNCNYILGLPKTSDLDCEASSLLKIYQGES